MADARGVDVRGPVEGRQKEVLSEEALAFVASLHRNFDHRRRELLQARAERQRAFDAGELPDFSPDTEGIRSGDWQIAPEPEPLQRRWVEITGPTDAKMMINALNSGADCFMADFEDSNSPMWANMVQGQVNLYDAVRRKLEFSQGGKDYRLNPELATLLVRPRGWHLDEKHVLVDGEKVAGALFDFGIYLFHNAKESLDRGAGPYFYLPKLEHHLEARLWDDVFSFSEEELGLEHGTIKATVLLEVILSSFQMDEILYELRDHSSGLNAGRWDYIFSAIKKFRSRPEFVLPDRKQVTMTVPFMRAYTELLVRTCHKRGAHAIGGMSAFIPSRKNPEINEKAFDEVRRDKERESGDGFDGTWVAHPDLVDIAREPFAKVLGDRDHQVDNKREDVSVGAAELLDIRVPDGRITEAGLRNNVSVGLQYLSSWLSGNGAAAIFNLMEDAATAEIARSQVWQWVHNAARLDDGTTITRELVQQVIEEELDNIREMVGEEAYAKAPAKEAQAIFEEVALADDFVEFLTLPAYNYLD